MSRLSLTFVFGEIHILKFDIQDMHIADTIAITTQYFFEGYHISSYEVAWPTASLLHKDIVAGILDFLLY